MTEFVAIINFKEELVSHYEHENLTEVALMMLADFGPIKGDTDLETEVIAEGGDIFAFEPVLHSRGLAFGFGDSLEDATGHARRTLRNKDKPLTGWGAIMTELDDKAARHIASQSGPVTVPPSVLDVNAVLNADPDKDRLTIQFV